MFKVFQIECHMTHTFSETQDIIVTANNTEAHITPFMKNIFLINEEGWYCSENSIRLFFLNYIVLPYSINKFPIKYM